MAVPLEPCLATARQTAPEAEVSAARELERIYEEHFAFVWRSLRGLGVSPASLDDAVQDVFLVVHRRLGDFQQRSSLKTWLFGIAYRVAANARRTQKRRQTAPLPNELSCSEPSPEEYAERRESSRFVSEFLNRTDEDQRAAFTACILEGMTVPEAAEALGVNPNTLYSRLRLVRARFLDAIATREGR